MGRAEALTVAELVSELGITRLCHLTPFRNLVHLASADRGLMSLQQLAVTGGMFDQQDLERLDGHPDHISCSIEYPNGWYLRQRKLRATPIQRLFPDWVCLTISPERLWADATRVCVRNASAQFGALVEDVSPESLRALYDSPITGAGGRQFYRQDDRPRACPTDDQAEVLLHRKVPYSDVMEVIVGSESDAKRMHAALGQIGADLPLRWLIAPVLFETTTLSNAIARGEKPAELEWEPGS